MSRLHKFASGRREIAENAITFLHACDQVFWVSNGCQNAQKPFPECPGIPELVRITKATNRPQRASKRVNEADYNSSGEISKIQLSFNAWHGALSGIANWHCSMFCHMFPNQQPFREFDIGTHDGWIWIDGKGKMDRHEEQ